MSLFFVSIRYVPLVEMQTISYSSVFFISILSIFFLGEKIGTCALGRHSCSIFFSTSWRDVGGGMIGFRRRGSLLFKRGSKI